MRGPAETALRVAVVVLAALTTPVTAALVRFAVLVVALRRTREDVVVLGSLVAGLALQGLLDIGATNPLPDRATTTARLPTPSWSGSSPRWWWASGGCPSSTRRSSGCW